MTQQPPAHAPFVWWNGRLVPWDEATVHVTALEWVGVGSVFEGIKGYWNAERETLYIFRLAEHFERFDGSMKIMRLNSAWSAEALFRATVDLCRACNIRWDTYIRPFAYFGKGRSFNRGAEGHVLINVTPFETRLGTGRVAHVCVSSWTRIADNAMPARVKAVANYHNSRLAATEAQINGYDGAILINHLGKVAEGPGATLMLVKKGKLIVPAVTSDVLESITRATIMQIAHEVLRIPVEEREVDRTELYLADEAFFCGTGAEVSPIGSIDRYQLGDGGVGPITAELDRIYHDLVRGRDQTYPGWATPVPMGAREAVPADD